jgi:hypothetical protein
VIGALASGRALRGVVAWAVAALAAAGVGATATTAFLLLRESVLHAPFSMGDWWVFLNLWRPLAVSGAVLALLLTAPFAVAAVLAIRRTGWPRPLADILAGIACAYAALVLLVVVARVLGPMGG